jgi:hypothetical protein
MFEKESIQTAVFKKLPIAPILYLCHDFINDDISSNTKKVAYTNEKSKRTMSVWAGENCPKVVQISYTNIIYFSSSK